MPNNRKPDGESDIASTSGWNSSFPRFQETSPRIVRVSLEKFVESSSESQIRAWDDSIPRLQQEAGEVLSADARAHEYTAILEYALPLESRRCDAVFLVSDGVLVVELKGTEQPSQADVDQVSAYARDLRAYHRECQSRPVHAVLVPTRAKHEPFQRDDVWITGPATLDGLVGKLSQLAGGEPPSAEQFLRVEAYRPLPSLVQAARELFESGEVREVWRARAATDPAVEQIASIAHEAARTQTRHLVLVTGTPGSGKTLVGMRAVHAHFLDDLAVTRDDGQPTAPGLFLSGNGPLVEVLQHVLRGAGGGGRTFIRHIKDYLDVYVPKVTKIPPQHLLVFDEAQRAFSPDRVQKIHPKWPASLVQSEPSLFVELCDRMPQWSVLVGLIGTGQEIHLGEEGGLVQWRAALEESRDRERWTVHAPALVEEIFAGSPVRSRWTPALNLDTELRFHAAANLHGLVASILEENDPDSRGARAAESAPEGGAYGLSGIRLWATRDLLAAKRYLWSRYEEQPDARFGVLTSSRDKLLEGHGVDNSYQATRLVRYGPWYTENEKSPTSCRRLDQCVTEFGAQGLELDMALLAWGSDFVRSGGRWSDADARGYKRGAAQPVDPFQLRKNAYRVLLTRGRDGTVVFVPDERILDETWDFLLARGFKLLPT